MIQLKPLAVAFCLSSIVAAVPANNAKVVDLPIWSEDDYYSVSFAVGTPPQNYRLQFDTGSSTTFLDNAACTPKDCPNVSGFPRNMYNIPQSSTGKFTGVNTTNTYDGGAIAGPVAQDCFHIEGLAPWSQTFVDSTLNLFGATAADGLFGLAFPYIAANGTQSMLQAMGKQGVLAEPKFGIYYGDVNSNQTMQGGILTMGGTRENDFVKEGLVEVPIVKTNYDGVEYEVWKTDLASIKGSGSKEAIKTPNKLVTFDTGSGYIQVSNKTVHALYESLGLGWNYTLILEDKQILYCDEFNSSWSVTFGFGKEGDRKVTLYGDELAMPGFPAAPGACWPPFSGAGGDYNIFGTPMLKALYSTWDWGSFNPAEFKPSVRFGKLKKHKPVGSQ
ncbi:hypothetical protein FPRO05_04932 [Fusarium proliferatum]|uniref:Peptidase A1 domain-containing protein n=1 Tax=Gibberella intermedia TaxID=948311 RepID=A0A365MP43_GIBIN|nr:hypothetical protein FPRO05_04932 [Fusarium proliferatum]